jgi:hypothetical protein
MTIKNNFFYSIIIYENTEIIKKKLFIFLNSIYKIKGGKIFFVFIPASGLKSLKKIKNFQEQQGFKFGEQPIISYEEENFFAGKLIKRNDLMCLCLVAKLPNNDYSEISKKILKQNKYVYSIKNKMTSLSKIDLITPLNMREDSDVMEASFLLSKLAIKVRSVKEKICPLGFPLIFFSFIFIYDVFLVFKNKKLFVSEVDNYYKYLLNYFEFSPLEKKDIEEKSQKYVLFFDQMMNKKLPFQLEKSYNNFVESIVIELKKEKILLSKLNDKIGKQKMNGMFFHWFNNSLGVSFSQEIAVLFIFKKWYAKKNKSIG